MNLVYPRVPQFSAKNHLLSPANSKPSPLSTESSAQRRRNLKMDLDDDSFYICTELTPRCFVVQKAVQIDRGQLKRVVGDMSQGHSPRPSPLGIEEGPPPPQMPYWFTPECRDNLMNIESPLQTTPSPVPSLNTSAQHSTSASSVDLRQQLKAQLEYYFSRENLITDRYLRCQMDSDQYVPISIIAGFRKIVQLTTDYDLIKQVLRESNQVEVDERGEKVRPVCRRCTIIIREISEEHKEEIEKMLADGPAYQELKYGLNESWYITYANEEKTQKAYMHLQSLGKTFQGKPICARIKAGGPPSNAELANMERAPSRQIPSPFMNESQFMSLEGQSQLLPLTPLMDLGQVLASFGFVPRATYRPGATKIHVEEHGQETEESGTTLGAKKFDNQTSQNNMNNNPNDSANPRNSPSPRGTTTNRRYQNPNRNGYYQPSAPLNNEGLLGAYCPLSATPFSTMSMVQQQKSTMSARDSNRGGRGGYSKRGMTNFSTGSLSGDRHTYQGRRHTTSFNSNSGRDATISRPQTLASSASYHPTEGITQQMFPPYIDTTDSYSQIPGECISPIPATLSPQQAYTQEPRERPRYNTYHTYERRPIGGALRSHRDNDWNNSGRGGNTAFNRSAADRRSGRSEGAASSGEEGPRRQGSDEDVVNVGQTAAKRMEGRKPSSQSSAYSFEERAFPSLTEQKPEPVKPAEKPSFSTVAAGKRYAKPEPKKSYAEKLKEKSPISESSATSHS